MLQLQNHTKILLVVVVVVVVVEEEEVTPTSILVSNTVCPIGIDYRSWKEKMHTLHAAGKFQYNCKIDILCICTDLC